MAAIGRAARDAHFDRLAERLAALESANIDVGALVDSALSEQRPLPDERTADALWWRLVRSLGPAALRATADSTPSLRPAWSAHLQERLGKAVADGVMADGMWPALVAAVHARPAEWTAEQLIDAATSGSGSEVRAEQLCSALVWRIATMTDQPDEDEPEPPEPIDTHEPAEDPARVPAAAKTSEPSVTAERILELNRHDLAYFTHQFPRSWAPDYLRGRIGTDLSDQPTFSVGYAPPGPTSLIHHLTALGATADELVDAGLARVTDRGRLIDTFPDRLVFPIHSGEQLVGFIGRRNPRKGDSEYAGPKYLNTRSTAVFTKGEQLFGLHDGSAALAAGATPVLVEGPLDAIAVSIASRGFAVGIAPLGTAFTEAQAAQLRPYWKADASRIVIATDPDAAGWQSAQRAFWRLSALRANPRHLALPDGVDPADLLRSEGPTALAGRLANAAGFGRSLIDRTIEDRLGGHSDDAARIWLGRDLARVIGALPPEEWPEHSTYVAQRLDLPLDMVHLDVFDAGTAWTDDPQACAQRQIAGLRPQPTTPVRKPVQLPLTATQPLPVPSPVLTTRPHQRGVRR